MVVKFDGVKISELLTWGDLEILESGTHKASIEVLSRFMLADDGTPLSQADAKKVLRGLKPKDAGKIITDFYHTLKEGAVNPQTADS